MKNNFKLKIICMLCVVTAAFSSCKKSELAEEKGLYGNHKNLAIAGDGKWDLLGHGYDVTGELFERKNTSKVSIFDLTRFYADYPTKIVTPTDTKGDYNVYYGANAYDYVKEVNKKQTFGTTISGGDKDKTQYSTSNFSLTNDNQNNYTYSGKYSYATYESWFRIKSIDFTDDVTVELLKNYLTPDFTAYLSNYSAEQIVQTYGTHILLGIDIGGRLKYDYRGSIVKEATFDKKLEAIKAGFSLGIAKIFSVDLSADLTTEEKTTISNETTEKLFRGTFYGGNNSGTSFSGDALGNTSQSINLVTWQQSINVNNASLIGINRSVPIYEFITDPVKKQQVKAAVEKYISDRQINLTSPKLQLYDFYSTALGHIFTVDPNFPAKNPGTWRRIINDPIYVYESQIPGSVPVYTMQHRTGSIYCLTRDNTIDLNVWAPTNYPVFYAYDNQAAGTVPVHQFYHPNKFGDGYFYDLTLNPTWNGWIENTTKFYAFNSAN